MEWGNAEMKKRRTSGINRRKYNQLDDKRKMPKPKKDFPFSLLLTVFLYGGFLLLELELELEPELEAAVIFFFGIRPTKP